MMAAEKAHCAMVEQTHCPDVSPVLFLEYEAHFSGDMHMTAYTIRPLTMDEAHTAVEWADNEGWNPGVHDAGVFYRTDPGGFLGGFVDDELAATLSAVRYDRDFGFLGFYIVRPDLRGKGYGLRLWEAGINLMDGMLMGLDGVPQQQAVYERGGFEVAYRNVRYHGWGGDDVPRDVLGIDEVPEEQILEYDRACFPARRDVFLRLWLTSRGGSFRGVFEGGALRGYGYLRPCRVGFKIGPLFADNAEYAERLFLALRADAGKAPFFLDTPECTPQARELAERYGMKPSFETVRMYANGRPEMALDRVFGVTSFELG